MSRPYPQRSTRPGIFARLRREYRSHPERPQHNPIQRGFPPPRVRSPRFEWQFSRKVAGYSRVPGHEPFRWTASRGWY